MKKVCRIWGLALLALFLALSTPPIPAEAHLDGKEVGIMYDVNNPWWDGYTAWLNCNRTKTSNISYRFIDYAITDYRPDYAFSPSAPRAGEYVESGPDTACNSRSGYTDAYKRVRNEDVLNLCKKAGIKPSADGTYTCYLQPIVGIFESGVDTGERYYSLNDWIHARPWSKGNIETFPSNYNKRIQARMSTQDNVKISYKTLNDGNGYTANTPITSPDVSDQVFPGNWGSLNFYRDRGMKGTIQGQAGSSGNRTWVLTGIQLTNTGDGYDSGRIACETNDNNLITIGQNYKLKENTLSTHQDVSQTGYVFNRSTSPLYTNS